MSSRPTVQVRHALALTIATVVFLWLPTDALARRGELPSTPIGQGITPATTLSIPAPDVFALRSEDEANRASGVKTLRYADPVPVNADPGADGTWDVLPDGTRRWRLNVVGRDATDINLGFETYELPHGSKLWVISADHDYYEGPYTHEDNAEHGQLWVPVVPGDEMIVELQVPAQTKFEPRLVLNHVGYGYTDLFHLNGDPKQGSCNNDVVCPEGDPWRDQIQSVATYSYGGSTLCTGQMVIDADNTFRPFFLTAYHCGPSPSNAPSMVVYWNFQSPVCGQLSGGDLSDNQTGAVFRASRQDVDMALVELDDLPDANSNVFYSGWDRSGVPANGSVAIHHPGTDEKAISFNDDTLGIQTSCIGGFAPDTHWLVDNWEDGTTEPGSSGSGIWDPDNKLLVGFLSGGLASCTVIDYDCYGRFDVAWDGPSPATRLRDWLDPNGVGGLQVQGSFPSNDGVLQLATVETTDDCGGTSDGIIAPGESVQIEMDVVARFGDVTGMSGTLQALTPGVTVDQGTSNFPDALKDTTVRGDVPFEISLDEETVACFSEVELLASFADDQGYTFDFPIRLTVGQLQGPAGLPIAIADNTINSTFSIGEDLSITDLNVFVEIDHTWVGDLRIDLTSPAGTTVTLLDRPGTTGSGFGCSDDNMVVTFDSNSFLELENLCNGNNPWFSGTARPFESLTAFNGESTQGTWTLTVVDNAGGDTGQLVDWSLLSTPAIEPGVCEPCAVTNVPGTITVSKAYPDPVSIFVAPDGSGDRLDDAQAWDGVPGSVTVRVDATIEVVATDGGGDPLVGLPASEFFLSSDAGNLVACEQLAADGPTDANGRTTYTGSLVAGGTRAVDELIIIGSPTGLTTYAPAGSGLDIRFNSADLDGNGVVDIVDVGEFAIAFAGAYSYSVDYAWNGVNDLADIGRFSEALGATCGIAPRAIEIEGDATLALETSGATNGLEPGSIVTARLVARGSDVALGIEAWEAALDLSNNLRLRGVRVPEGHLDFGRDGHMLVGTAGAIGHDARGVLLAHVDLEVTGEGPATIALDGTPLMVVDERGAVAMRTESVVLATLNGATPDAIRDFALTNTPNPFNPKTEIQLALPRGGDTAIAIFDVSGRLVRRIAIGTVDAGVHNVTWSGDDHNGRPVVSGVYYARAIVDGEATGPSRKLSLLK